MKEWLIRTTDGFLWCVQGIFAVLAFVCNVPGYLTNRAYYGVFKFRGWVTGAPMVQEHDAESGFGPSTGARCVHIPEGQMYSKFDVDDRVTVIQLTELLKPGVGVWVVIEELKEENENVRQEKG